MIHQPCLRSYGLRAALSLALLAWTLLASGAQVAPLRGIDAVGANPAMQTAQQRAVTERCCGLAMAHAPPASDSAPVLPVGGGDGCCHNGHCYCVSPCSGIVGVAFLGVVLPPADDPALSPIHSEPTPAHPAPPLRPPIV